LSEPLLLNDLCILKKLQQGSRPDDALQQHYTLSALLILHCFCTKKSCTLDHDEKFKTNQIESNINKNGHEEQTKNIA
jgi:hypothetical protein